MPAKVDAEKCTGCESCLDACPSEAIKMEDDKAVVDVDNCVFFRHNSFYSNLCIEILKQIILRVHLSDPDYLCQ